MKLAPVLLALLSWSAITARPVQSAESKNTVVLTPPDASWSETLAAREVRRYVYLRTGRLFPVMSEVKRVPSRARVLVIARQDRDILRSLQVPGGGAELRGLAPQGYYLKTLKRCRIPGSEVERDALVLAGGDDAGVLYAAYRLAEVLGVRFYLHGDVLPDGQVSWALPDLDERGAPLFALRGIQPFHDFPEGPDWWNTDDYLAIVGQLPKLRMNFFGLHTYPEGRPNAEPTVWIGLAQDIGDGGRVKFSYPSSYQNTLRGNWGYTAKKTGDFVFGSAALFERDDYGPDVMSGFVPAPETPESSNEVFDRTALMLRQAFTFARQLGVKTCAGTETPLVVPKAVQSRVKALGKEPTGSSTAQELYEGIFRRAQQAYPLDYYWFWTPENWTWSGVKEEEIAATTNDFFAAIAAHRQVNPGFSLATCGWVLGPQQDRAMFDKILPKDMALSCINRQVGYTPVDAGFAEVQGRSKWAIPWMEDDPALSSPQLWVGRMRRDAADALRYGCDGLMGIHWRTRALGPNVSALAHAAWEQKPWSETYHPEPPMPQPAKVPGAEGGQVASFPDNTISGTDEPTIYQTVRYNVSAYHLLASNGTCEVTLKFCEPHYGEAGKRVFDVKLQGQLVITNLDIFARVGKNRALDFDFKEVSVTNGWIDIEFVPHVEFPSIAGIVITGDNATTRINCGGPAYGDYTADNQSAAEPKQVFAACGDFYLDWARHEFGNEAGPAAAAIFERVDCKLPLPSVWTSGPGGIKPDARPWEQVRKDYTFVDEFAALAPVVKGAGSQERFDYWRNTLLYFRTIAEANCAWGEYNRAAERIKQSPDRQRELARTLALPLREKLVSLYARLFQHLLSTVSTTGELGTVANWNQQNLRDVLTKPGEELAKMLGEPLPASAQPDNHYTGPTRVIVPTNRTSVTAGESLKLKVIVLSGKPARSAAVYWRNLGQGRFVKAPLLPMARGVYRAELPGGRSGDFEYFIKVQPDEGKPVYFPASAPRLNQTVVVYPKHS